MYEDKLAKEAAFTGALMVPWFYLISNFTTAFGITQNKEMVDLFVSGATFHLAAEYTGVNRWYLKHSAAHYKKMRKFVEEKDGQQVEKRKCGISFR